MTLGGKTYEADLAALVNLSIGEARIIKRETGLTVMGWMDGMQAFNKQDPDILAGLVFLFKSRAGETVDWGDLDKISVKEFWGGLKTSEPETSKHIGDAEPPSEIGDVVNSDPDAAQVSVISAA